jgi:T3SS negative regulator,GrlR
VRSGFLEKIMRKQIGQSAMMIIFKLSRLASGTCLVRGILYRQIPGGRCGRPQRDVRARRQDARRQFRHTYEEIDGEIVTEIKTMRHNPDPNFRPMAGNDDATLIARGRADGALYRFEGSLDTLPGAVFKWVMTPVEEQPLPIAGGVGEGGAVNGLYSIQLRLLDGIDGGLTGVMLLNNGRILGGDACFYYLGTYTSANGRWKGQILNQEHTPARGENPVFGGHEVGIGFSGTCDEEGAQLEATALAGKRSLRLTAELKLMRRA